MSTNMPRLLDLQRQLRGAVLGGDTAALVAAIRGDGLDPASRLGIYRNHAFATLGVVLQGTFPVVCRLVDQRFFAYAAREYVREHPPHSRCLVEYGSGFADFLAGFEPCRGLPYLADVARFEWALQVAATVPEAPPLQIAALAAVSPEEAARLVLSHQPSISPLPGRSTRSGRRTSKAKCRRSISRAPAPALKSAGPATRSPGEASTLAATPSEQRWRTASCSLPQSLRLL